MFFFCFFWLDLFKKGYGDYMRLCLCFSVFLFFCFFWLDLFREGCGDYTGLFFLFFCFSAFRFLWQDLLREGHGDYKGLCFSVFCFFCLFPGRTFSGRDMVITLGCLSAFRLFFCFSVFLFSWLDLLRKGYGEYIGLFSSFSVFSIFLRARLDEAEIIKKVVSRSGANHLKIEGFFMI